MLVILACGLLPIPGYVVIVPGRNTPLIPAPLGPQMRLDPPFARPGDEVRLHVTDRTPWTYVLLTVNGSPVRPESWKSGLNKQWTWTFRFVLPTGPSEIVFYRNCNTGCVEQGRMVLGEAPVPPSGLIPTKLGLVFPTWSEIGMAAAAGLWNSPMPGKRRNPSGG